MLFWLKSDNAFINKKINGFDKKKKVGLDNNLDSITDIKPHL